MTWVVTRPFLPLHSMLLPGAKANTRLSMASMHLLYTPQDTDSSFLFIFIFEL